VLLGFDFFKESSIKMPGFCRSAQESNGRRTQWMPNYLIEIPDYFKPGSPRFLRRE
jgi:hypothetical protein